MSARVARPRVGWVLGTLSGLLMSLVHRDLAAHGRDLEAHVEECRLGGTRAARYFNCTYRFRTVEGGPVYDGSFRTRNYRPIGSPVMIRYLPDHPNTSAAVKDLEDEGHVPLSIALLGAGWLAWLSWRAWRARRARRRAAAEGQTMPRISLAAALVASGFVLVGATAAVPRPRKRDAKAPAPVALGVVIAVDGLSQSRLATYRPWFSGGLKRLLDEGQVETACRYRHLNTQTGPGHASIATGEPPRLHGIVGNDWYETGADGRRRSVYCTDQRLEGREETIRGPGNLRVPTLGDRLIERHPASRVVSLGGKDRASVFLAGRDRRHAAYWYESATGRFVTSAAYDPPPAVRGVVDAFNGRSAGAALPQRFGLRWSPLPPPADDVARPTAVPSRVLMDYQLPALGLGWDHHLDWNGRTYGSAVYASPFLDTLLADLALAVIEDEALALGRGGTPDLLALSFSAHDAVAHNYGPESEEALDALRRLDLEIARVLEALERRIGRSRIVLGFSADHGFAPIPEAVRVGDRRPPGGRLTDGTRTVTGFVQRLNRVIADELCLARETRAVAGGHGWTIAYDRAAFPLRTVERRCGAAGRELGAADVDRVLPAVVQRLYAEEIDAVWLVSEHERWPDTDPVSEFVRNAFDPSRSGDAFLVPRPGVMIHSDPGRGSTHGTHFDYDAHVPLVFWGAPFPPRESGEAATPYDLAPTLARALGVEMRTRVGRPRS